MISDELVKRINELWHKQNSVGLTDEEKNEQKKLREEYLAATKAQVRSMLQGIKPVKNEATTNHHHQCSCKHCKH